MKNIIRVFVALASAMLLMSGCYKDGTDHVSNELRISLTPSVSGFAADGTTLDGSENYTAAVIVNYGASVWDGDWTAEILDSPQWVRVTPVMIASTYPDTWGTGMHECRDRGIEISVSPNEGEERSFTLRISLPRGEYRDYVFRQKGNLFDKPRAEGNTVSLCRGEKSGV